MMTPIQATIVGYASKPSTVFAAYDSETRVLVVSVEAGYRAARRDGCIVISNDTTVERDSLFDESMMRDAILSFFALQAGVSADGKSSRLLFSEKAARSNPINSIEKDGMDANGQKYRVSEAITCAQVAVLTACRYAHSKAGPVDQMLGMADAINEIDYLHHGGHQAPDMAGSFNEIDYLNKGGILTI